MEEGRRKTWQPGIVQAITILPPAPNPIPHCADPTTSLTLLGRQEGKGIGPRLLLYYAN